MVNALPAEALAGSMVNSESINRVKVRMRRQGKHRFHRGRLWPGYMAGEGNKNPFPGFYRKFTRTRSLSNKIC